MLRGYRLALCAAFGWLILAADKPPAEQPKGGAQAAKQQKPVAQPEPRAPAPPAAVDEAPPYAPYKDRNANPCYYAKNHDAADLCAQWRAAIATEKAAHEARRATNWAIAATLMSVLGTVGLILSIWQTFGALGEARRGNRLNLLTEKRARREAREAEADTKAALKIADRNAKAAAKLVRVAEDTAKRQLRAYVNVTDVNVREADPLFPNRLAVGVKLKNAGATPALDFSAKLWADVYPASPTPFIERPFEPMGQGTVVGSGTIKEIPDTLEINGVTARDTLAGNATIVIQGWAQYMDVFGERRETRFCFHRDPTVRKAGLNMAASKKGNSST